MPVYQYLLLPVCAGLVACASSGSSPAVRGSLVRIDYARITEMRRVEMPSAAPAGTMVGGFTGLVLSRNQSGPRQIASGIGGAALGALATNALEDRRGYEYTLRSNNNIESRFTTDKGFLRRGDCVSVEQAQYSNIRRVPSSFCAASITPEPASEHVAMARQCNDAKNQLLASTSQSEIDLAVQKMKILCQDFDE